MRIASMGGIPSPFQQFCITFIPSHCAAASLLQEDSTYSPRGPRRPQPAQAGAIGRANLKAGSTRTATTTTRTTSSTSTTSSCPTTEHSSGGGSDGEAKGAARTKPPPLTAKAVRRHLQRTQSLSPRTSFGGAGEALRAEGFEPAALPVHCVDTFLQGG